MCKFKCSCYNQNINFRGYNLAVSFWKATSSSDLLISKMPYLWPFFSFIDMFSCERTYRTEIVLTENINNSAFNIR